MVNSWYKKCDLSEEYFFTEGCFITELSNSSDDPDLSVARARVEPGEITRWHSLNGITERYVIVEGHGLVEVGDFEPQRVSVGDTVIIPAGVRQRISNTGDKDLIFLALCTPRFTESAYNSLES